MVAGAVAMGKFGSFVLHGAVWVDRILARKRTWMLALVSVSVLAAPWIDRQLEWHVLPGLSLVAFVGLLTLFALARLDAFRDETGWHWRLVKRTFREARLAVWAWLERIWRATGAQKSIDFGKPVFMTGLLVGASANVGAAVGVDDEIVTILSVVGIALLSSAVLALASGWGWLRRVGSLTGRTIHASDVPTVVNAVRNLPLVLDCRNSSDVATAANHSSHPLVAALLFELMKPWPRPYYNDEREYQDRLLKRLLMSMPEANPRTERWIGEQERADMVLGDDNGGLLIEMKIRANTSTIDRLIGQAWKSLRVWRGRGPMLLVLCKTGPEVTSRLEADLSVMRQQGHAVLAVLAAP
jgi:hypothetical protein